MQFHNYSLSDIEHMIPWERLLFIDMLAQHIKEQNDKARDLAAIRKNV